MKIKFRIGILFSILVLLLLSTISIWSAGDWSARETASSLGESLMNRVGANVSEHIVRKLHPAEIATLSVLKLLEQGLVSLDDPENLLDHLEIIRHSHQVDRLYIGTQEGRFFMVTHNPSGSSRRRVVDPHMGVQFWSSRNEEGHIQRSDEALNFDPRTRTWYKQSVEHGQIWTEVYRFESDNQPGITRAQSLFAPHAGCNPCVTGADLTLVDLSSFLSELNISDNGLAFLLDTNSNLIAHPKLTRLLGENDSLVRAEESTDLLVQTAGLHLKQSSKAEDTSTESSADSSSSYPNPDQPLAFTATISDAPWKILLFPLSTSEDLPSFKAAIAIPESDFLQTLKRTRIVSGVIALLSILIGIFFAIAFSKGISKPIVELEQSMKKVGSFDLDVEKKISSIYVEMDHMVDTFDRMVGSLRSFSRYVPKDLVRELLASGKEAELIAEEREISMFFSDIEGFTAYCEHMEPKKLVDQLGEYFECVVSNIKANDGTIDKFIGDAVMAIWNAPGINDQHPLSTAIGALSVQSATTSLNERWKREGVAPFHTRIGISTATVVVGNVGSSQRISYTALGDGVNLTARLEAANKFYSTQILASDSLVARIPADTLVIQPVDILIVKGKARNVKIYEVIGRVGDVEARRVEAAEIYASAFDLYLSRGFHQAAKRFENVLDCLPGYRPAEILLERCSLLRTNQPNESWDGSFVMQTK